MVTQTFLQKDAANIHPEHLKLLDTVYLVVYTTNMVFDYDHNKSLGYLSGLANRLLSNTLAAQFQAANIDMTAEQWGAIIILLNEGAITQRQLGERPYLEKSSVSRLLEGLERRNWIVRTKNPKDSRQKLVTPTPKVLETVERCSNIAKTILKDAQRGLTEEEQSACQAALLHIISNLNKGNK
ncbi:MarR family winged helix-turn-helix transcriptional regulator [Desulfobacter sp.]|uniref:MarR family winged helix-turn-helix transcriptional regulator n=1 Tax=Desulfobacter sp. TaxID=2294 RepID=UPI003D0F5D24